MKKFLIALSLLCAPMISYADVITNLSVSSSWEKSPTKSGRIVMLLEGNFAGSTVTVQLEDNDGDSVNTEKTCTSDCATEVAVGSFRARATITDVVGTPSIKVSVSGLGR